MSDTAPDGDVLRRFLLGALPPRELEAVGRYVEAHPELASTLNALRADDTLLAALRVTPRPADAPELDRLVATFSFLPARAPTPAASDTHELPTDALPPELEADVRALFDPPQAPDELGRLDGYRLLRVLGKGGMGVVLEAEDVRLGRRVAVKLVRPRATAGGAARERFRREARTAAAVEHDYIVPIYHVGEHRGAPFLVMPLLVGETLAARLDGPDPLPAADVLLIGLHLAEGLAAAHAAGLVHRDLKPSNVWLEPDSNGAPKRARLFDFGLAKAQSGEEDALTNPGAILGTPAYMAPEQAAGQAVDQRTDLFALGAVLYHAATGRRPFAGSDTFAILTALATHTPPPAAAVNPHIPPGLSDLISRLLAREPAGRPASARQVADELLAIIASLASAPAPSSAAVAPPAPAYAPKRSRRRAWAAVALVAALALGVVLMFGKTVVRVISGEGELVVEVDDPDVEVLVKRGDVILRDRGKDREFVLRAGDGEVVFFDPATGAEAATKAFRLKAGDRVRVVVTAAALAGRPKPMAPPVAPHAQAVPSGDSPPAADAFPGKVVYAETFDTGERNDFVVVDNGQTNARFERGLYVCEHPLRKNPNDHPSGFGHSFGPNPRDVAFVLRARVTDMEVSIGFRALCSETRKSQLTFSIFPNGKWDLTRSETTNDGQGWATVPERPLRKAGAPEPALTSGNWFTLAVRSRGRETVVWVNGKELTRVTEEFVPPPELKRDEKGFRLGTKFIGGRSCKYELDFMTVWELPPE